MKYPKTNQEYNQLWINCMNLEDGEDTLFENKDYSYYEFYDALIPARARENTIKLNPVESLSQCKLLLRKVIRKNKDFRIEISYDFLGYGDSWQIIVTQGYPHIDLSFTDESIEKVIIVACAKVLGELDV